MVPFLSETSTVAEMIMFLKYADMEDRFDLVETILTSREHVLKTALAKLRDQYNVLEQDMDAMVKKHDFAVLEQMKLEDDKEVLKEEKNQLIVDFTEKIEGLKVEKLEIEREKEGYKKELEKVNAKKLKYFFLNEAITEFEKVIGKILNEDVMGVEEGANGGGEESSGDHILRNMAKVKMETSEGLGGGDDGCSDSQKEGPHASSLDCDNGLPSGNLLISEAGCNTKLIPSSSKITGLLGSAPAIIDLSDGDDDVPTGGASSVGKNGLASLESGNEVLAPENVKTENDCTGNDLDKLCAKRKRSTSEREDDDDIPIAKLFTKSTQVLKARMLGSLALDGISPSKFDSPFIKQCEEKASLDRNHGLVPQKQSGLDGVDNSSHHPVSSEAIDTNVQKAVARLSGTGSTWMNAADMLSSFKQDDELCMEAVCALYRQHIAHKPIKGLSSLTEGGFNSHDIVKGTSVAKYLIDTDPELKMRRSVSGVRETFPQMFSDCRRLAIEYYDQLFNIYQRKLDPFFCPRP